jgi:hypothetical protein
VVDGPLRGSVDLAVLGPLRSCTRLVSDDRDDRFFAGFHNDAGLSHFPISSDGGRKIFGTGSALVFRSLRNALMAELPNDGCAAGHALRDDGCVSGGGVVFAGDPACSPRVNGDRDIVDTEAAASRTLQGRRRFLCSRQKMHRFPDVPPPPRIYKKVS